MTTRGTIEEWLERGRDDGEGCPPPEVFLPSEWADLDDAARERAIRHLEVCPACAAERDLARAFEAPLLANPQAEAEVASLLASTAAGSAGGKVLRPSFLSRLLPQRALALAAAALVMVAAAVVVRNQLAAPRLPDVPAQDVARGGRIEVRSPVGDRDEIPAVFDWRQVDEAASYRLTLTSVDGSVLWATAAPAPPVALPAEAAAALRPRVLYFWTVEALDPRGQPIARSEPTEFRFLDDADERREIPR